MAKWNGQQLQEADELAFDIIRQIRNGNFWPPERKPPQYSEVFAAICQDDVFERQDYSLVYDRDSVGEVSP